MKKEIEKYEKIEQFLSGKLSHEEYEKVEELIASEPEYAREVARHRQVYDFILNSTYAKIKEQVRTIHEKKKNYLRLRNSRIRLVIGIITGFVITGIILYLLLSEKKNRELSIYPVATPDSLKSSDSQSFIDQGKEQENAIRIESGLSDPGKFIRTIDDTKQSETETELRVSLIQHQLEQPLGTGDSITPIIMSEKRTAGVQPVNNAEDEVPVFTEVYDCSEVSISANVIVEKSCEHESTGVLWLEESSISGGTPPYELSIDNQTSYHSALRLGSLPPDSYSIWIRDIYKCTTWLGNFLIESVNCLYEDKFAPEKGERWVVPNRDQACRLRIYNQIGALVFEVSFDFPGTYSWDGCKSNGELLPMGVYTFILELEEETTLKGSITIIR